MKEALVILAAIICVILLVQNSTLVNVKFLLWHKFLSLSVVVLTAFILGAVFGYGISSRKKKQTQVKK